MDRDTRISIAVGEGRQLHNNLMWHLLGAQVIMIAVLTVMDYFGASVESLLIAGLFFGVGALGGMIQVVALRLDAGRAYMEMWSDDAQEGIERLERAIQEARHFVPEHSHERPMNYDLRLYP